MGKAKCFPKENSVPLGTCVRAKFDTCDFFEVKLTTLDSLLERLGVGSIDIVKVDVEGAENLVLKGSLKTLSRCSRVVISAEHGKQLKQQCIELLKSLGYKVVTKKDMIYGIACLRNTPRSSQT